MIETMLTTLAVGTIWFWLLISIASIIIIACIENDNYAAPTITTIILGAIYWKALTALSWQFVAIFIGIFALFGVIWSAWKWHRYTNKKAAFFTEKYGSTLSSSQYADLKQEVSVYYNKSMLIGWIAFWPWSMIWSFTGDFFNMLYDTMTNVYQKITDRALGKFQVEEPKPPKNKNNDNASLYNRSNGY